MCINHDDVQNSEAVRALCEGEHDPETCPARINYLEARVREFTAYLDGVGKDGKAIVLAIHEAHLRAMEEDIFTEFYFSCFREEGESMVNINAEADLFEYRANEEHKCATDYWGMLHGNAYRAFMKTFNDPNPWGEVKYAKGLEFLDAIEERFNPDAPRQNRLGRSDYFACKRFRAKLHFNRFKLHLLTHEQWAYLVNWLNVLTSWEDKDTGEIKQYSCIMQNVMVDEKWEAEPVDGHYDTIGDYAVDYDAEVYNHPVA